MTAETLHRVDEKSSVRAATTLTSAFSNNHITKKLKLSQTMLKRMYETPVKIGLHSGEVYSTSDLCEGVMVFCAGERANPNLWYMMKNGMFFTSLSMIRLLANKDFRKLSMTMEREKKNLKIGPFLYLMVIGVSPEYQGKGYGGQLLTHLCERADREKKAIYLETQNEINVQWYEAFGFKVVKQMTISEWLTLWAMVREAN